MFTVVETQKSAPATAGAALVQTFADKSDAFARYHTILAAASKSGLLKHSATILDENGAYIISECHGTETVEE